MLQHTLHEHQQPCLPASHALCLPGAVILNKWMMCLQIVCSVPV